MSSPDARTEGSRAKRFGWPISTIPRRTTGWSSISSPSLMANTIGGGGPQVVFLNGLPVAVFELKNPADENATIWTAYQQLQTCQAESPSCSTPTSSSLSPMESKRGLAALRQAGAFYGLADKSMETRSRRRGQSNWETLIRGVFEKRRLLDLLGTARRLRGRRSYRFQESRGVHQFHAVNRAVQATVSAAAEKGTGVWE